MENTTLLLKQYNTLVEINMKSTKNERGLNTNVNKKKTVRKKIIKNSYGKNKTIVKSEETPQ